MSSKRNEHQWKRPSMCRLWLQRSEQRMEREWERERGDVNDAVKMKEEASEKQRLLCWYDLISKADSGAVINSMTGETRGQWAELSCCEWRSKAGPNDGTGKPNQHRKRTDTQTGLNIVNCKVWTMQSVEEAKRRQSFQFWRPQTTIVIAVSWYRTGTAAVAEEEGKEGCQCSGQYNMNTQCHLLLD